MAPSQSQPVKSLNKGSGRRRFVFKTFAQRVEEIDINVYRSLDTTKPEPTAASSFFLESLLQWRELNTAEDFISFYEEMMPWVQTLPQILLHKEAIISKLLCRLKMQAKLSLEPILRLIADLSRDLLEEFLPFLPRVSDSLVDLLKNGGEREPEILEQVFTSLSFVMMYLQKYLVRDVVHVLKITIKLRYYPKDYVQEFMAEAVSFLLRNAPTEQVIQVGSSDANEAELFALRIGCRELSRIGGLSPIIEGDSVSSIQWGFGKAIHPWRLADWVEEVQDISSLLGASFHLVLREANTMVDSLAREGIFHTSISFGV